MGIFILVGVRKLLVLQSDRHICQIWHSWHDVPAAKCSNDVLDLVWWSVQLKICGCEFVSVYPSSMLLPGWFLYLSLHSDKQKDENTFTDWKEQGEAVVITGKYEDRQEYTQIHLGEQADQHFQFIQTFATLMILNFTFVMVKTAILNCKVCKLYKFLFSLYHPRHEASGLNIHSVENQLCKHIC